MLVAGLASSLVLGILQATNGWAKPVGTRVLNKIEEALPIRWEAPSVGVLVIKALLFGVDIRAPNYHVIFAVSLYNLYSIHYIPDCGP